MLRILRRLGKNDHITMIPQSGIDAKEQKTLFSRGKPCSMFTAALFTTATKKMQLSRLKWILNVT